MVPSCSLVAVLVLAHFDSPRKGIGYKVLGLAIYSGERTSPEIASSIAGRESFSGSVLITQMFIGTYVTAWRLDIMEYKLTRYYHLKRQQSFARLQYLALLRLE